MTAKLPPEYFECAHKMDAVAHAWMKAHPFAEPRFTLGTFEADMKRAAGLPEHENVAIGASLLAVIDKIAGNEDARQILLAMDEGGYRGLTDADVAAMPRPAQRSLERAGELVRKMAEDRKRTELPKMRSRYLDTETTGCMDRFARHYGDWNEYHQSFRWQKLGTAAAHVEHQWSGEAHRARADADACRSVWRYLRDHDRAERQALAQAAEGTPGFDT